MAESSDRKRKLVIVEDNDMEMSGNEKETLRPEDLFEWDARTALRSRIPFNPDFQRETGYSQLGSDQEKFLKQPRYAKITRSEFIWIRNMVAVIIANNLSVDFTQKLLQYMLPMHAVQFCYFLSPFPFESEESAAIPGQNIADEALAILVTDGWHPIRDLAPELHYGRNMVFYDEYYQYSIRTLTFLWINLLPFHYRWHKNVGRGVSVQNSVYHTNSHPNGKGCICGDRRGAAVCPVHLRECLPYVSGKDCKHDTRHFKSSLVKPLCPQDRFRKDAMMETEMKKLAKNDRRLHQSGVTADEFVEQLHDFYFISECVEQSDPIFYLSDYMKIYEKLCDNVFNRVRTLPYFKLCHPDYDTLSDEQKRTVRHGWKWCFQSFETFVATVACCSPFSEYNITYDSIQYGTYCRDLLHSIIYDQNGSTGNWFDKEMGETPSTESNLNAPRIFMQYMTGESVLLIPWFGLDVWKDTREVIVRPHLLRETALSVDLSNKLTEHLGFPDDHVAQFTNYLFANPTLDWLSRSLLRAKRYDPDSTNSNELPIIVETMSPAYIDRARAVEPTKDCPPVVYVGNHVFIHWIFLSYGPPGCETTEYTLLQGGMSYKYFASLLESNTFRPSSEQPLIGSRGRRHHLKRERVVQDDEGPSTKRRTQYSESEPRNHDEYTSDVVDTEDESDEEEASDYSDEEPSAHSDDFSDSE